MACYRLLPKASNWTEGEDRCEREKMKLLTVTSEEENQMVLDIMKKNDLKSVWLGAHEEMDKWRWLDGES